MYIFVRPRPRRKPTAIARAEVDPIPILRPKWPAKMATQFFSFLFFGRAHSGPHAGYGSAPIYEEIPAETTFRAFSRRPQWRGFSPSSMHPMVPISSLSFIPPPGHGYGKSSRKARPLTCGRGRTADSHLEGYNRDSSMDCLIWENPDDSPRAMCPQSPMYLPGEFSSSDLSYRPWGVPTLKVLNFMAQ